jgi:hypothetical protein
MSSRIQFDTATLTWADFFSNGRLYSVPRFQRNYAWGEDEWLDLWNDLCRAVDERTVHYLGTVVLQERDDHLFEVIDGQQRLVTLTTLALAVIDAILTRAEQTDAEDRSSDEERARLLRDRFVSFKDPASLHERARLRLNANDDGFYRTYLLERKTPRNPAKLDGSEKKPWTAFEYFRKRVNERFAHKSTSDLASFVDRASQSTVLIRIGVQDELSAYTVFETLNARGLELTTTDLLKNYIFSLCASSETDLSLAQEQWQRIVNLVGLEDVPEFLYHFALSLGRTPTKHRLFQEVKSLIRNREEAFERLEDLQDAATWYVAAADPNDSLWSEFDSVRPYLRALRLFRADLFKALLLACRQGIRERSVDAAHLLRLLAFTTFRAVVIGRTNTANVLRDYQAAIQRTRLAQRWTVKSLFAEMRELYPSDEEFRAQFAITRLEGRQKAKLARYILAEIEAEAGYGTRDFDDGTLSLEHILPENPGRDWSHFTRDDVERDVYRLGNLALLEPSLNREVGSGGFDAKRAAYARSSVGLTREISAEEWTPESIRQRQDRLSELAARRFRIDFGST